MRFFRGRITGYVGTEDSVSYTYDANGNVLTVTDANGTVTRTYDVLNRVSSYTDTYGKTIGYEYDAVGNLVKLTYPDNTAVSYEYDANHNLIRVTDWQGRVTTYTYDENNRVVGVTKPDGSVTATVYDNMQRVISTVERTASGTVMTGFEYTYDDLSRIIEEKILANSTKMCYTYDNLSRVTKRTIKDLSDVVLSEESFTYDAAGNITGGSADDTFVYDTNNRLTSFNGNAVSYDLDGNMLSNGVKNFTYDSANRLITADGHTYTYNAENVRIRNLCTSEDTTYTYDTNCRLSRLLVKTTNGVVTKYVYGLGLVGEEVSNFFKIYHFDFRGSTVAITDANGNITDTFAYDTYGKLISRTGDSDIIFGYNGRDGVITDDNGLIYMRARYYSPEMKRFVNADILSGAISDSTSLNRYSYVNGNPVSFVDPFGLSAERGTENAIVTEDNALNYNTLYSVIVENIDDALTRAILFRIVTELRSYAYKIGTGQIVDSLEFFAKGAVALYAVLPNNIKVDVIESLSGITIKEHYNRLSLDDHIDFPDVLTKTHFIYNNWNSSVGTSCHQFTSPTQENKKYVSPDGRYEVIYDKDGYRVDDIRDVGTYNYASPLDDGLNHFRMDVLPWIFWGNSPEDTTTMYQRLDAFIIDGIQESVSNEMDKMLGEK